MLKTYTVYTIHCASIQIVDLNSVTQMSCNNSQLFIKRVHVRGILQAGIQPNHFGSFDDNKPKILKTDKQMISRLCILKAGDNP